MHVSLVEERQKQVFRCAAWNRLCIFSSFLGYIFNKILQKYKFIFFRANTCFTDFYCLLA